LREAVLHVAGRAGQHDLEDVLAGQRVRHELRAVGGCELRCIVDLALQLLVLGRERVTLVLGVIDLVAQVLGDRPVQGGGTDDDAEREGEEHRDDGDEVVPERDHENLSCIQLTTVCQSCCSESR
jgi:hypothetical protein